MDELTERGHAELLVLYQLGVDDIERAKQWSWSVSYQTILAQGGVLALYSAYVSSPDWWVRIVFVALLLAVTVVAQRHLSDSAEALGVFRERVARCRAALQKTSQNLMGDPTVKRTWPLQHLVWATFAISSILLVFYRTGGASGG
jgi:hypothetical protein